MSGHGVGYESPAEAESTSTQRLFFDDGPGASPPPEPGTKRRSVGVLRHLGSLVLGLALTPVALVLIDYGLVRRQRVMSGEFSADLDPQALLALIGAGALLFIVASLGRLSPLGPLLAGVVWGLAPWILVTFFVQRVYSGVDRLPEVYDRIGVYATYYGFGLYAAVAALLIGIGWAARWRRPR